MDFRQLALFEAVADKLSFSRAADDMAITQPALSRQIQQLEDRLGVSLFRRDKRNVALTPAGTYLREQVRILRSTVTDIEAQTRRIHHGLTGLLRIGHPGSALYSILPDALSELKQQFPDVTTTLAELSEREILDTLLTHRIDVGLTRANSTDDRIMAEPLFSEALALVVPDTHALTADTFTELAQCRQEPFILCSLDSSLHYDQTVLSMFEASGFRPQKLYEANYGATVLRLVERGLGVSILPISYQNGSSPQVRFLPLSTHTTLYIVWRKDDQNPILHNFQRICREACGGQGA